MKKKPETNQYSKIYDIFLSYRRDGGEAMAILLRDRLVEKGYNVFLDIEGLTSGSFNTRLLDVIENCKDFVLVCSKNALDRCVNEGDWVRREIAYAFELNKNIIPVMMRGFEFPDNLPEDIAAIPNQNGVSAEKNEYFDAAVDRMAKQFLLSKPKEIKKGISWLSKTIIGAAVIAVAIAVTVWVTTSKDEKTIAEAPVDNLNDIHET
jgi:hypothetical protein